MSNLPIIATFTFRGRVNSVSELPMDAAIYDVYAVENLTYVLLPQGWVNTNEIYGTTYTKDEVIAMLTELQLEIEEQKRNELSYQQTWNYPLNVCASIIQQKINALNSKCEGCEYHMNKPCEVCKSCINGNRYQRKSIH